MLRSLALTLLALSAASTSFAESPKHSFLIADSSKNRIAIIDEDGKTTWEYKIGPLHDLHMLDGGNVLFQTSWTDIVEVNPKTDEVVWKYDAKQHLSDSVKRVEVHAFQRLPSGNTMIAVSGATKIIEVDKAGKTVHEIALQVTKPNAHTDTRLVRQLVSGNYLVCHEADGRVCEYSREGKIVWDFEVPMFGKSPARGHGLTAFGNKAYSALRLANGNTLIGTGNGHSIVEVTPGKKVVWKLEQNDLPNIQLAWVTTLQELPNGNIVIGNCHATEANPQVVEVNRKKEVVWTFKDFERFGNATTNTQILTTNGSAIGSRLGSQR